MADAASESVEEQISAAYSVLEEIGIQQKDTLLVLNKIDCVPDPGPAATACCNRYPHAVADQRPHRRGLAASWPTAVGDALSRNFLDLDVEMGVDNGRSWPTWPRMARSSPSVTRRRRLWYTVACRGDYLRRLEEEGVVVQPHRNGETAGAASPDRLP